MLEFNEYTIADYISDYRDTIISFDTLFYKAVHSYEEDDTKYVMNEASIMDDYDADMLGDMIRNVTGEIKDLYDGFRVIDMSTSEFNKYKFNPKKLSYDVYGTTELWFLILRLNEMYSVTEFNTRRIKLFNNVILDKISEVLNREEERINISQDEVNNAILEG